MLPARSQIRPPSQPMGCTVRRDEARPISPIRRASRLSVRVACRALGLALLLVLPGGAQYGPMQEPPLRGTGTQAGGSMSGVGDTDPIEEEKRLRALNAERQRSLVSDTNKLLKLAHELNDEVNATKSDSLDPQELTQVAEIEKLAHNVKEKMSTSVKGTTDFQPFLFPQHR